MGGWCRATQLRKSAHLSVYPSAHIPTPIHRDIILCQSTRYLSTSLPTTHNRSTHNRSTNNLLYLPTTFLPTTYLPTPFLPTPYLPATHLPTSSHRSSSPKIRLAMVWFTLILSRCRSAAVRPRWG